MLLVLITGHARTTSSHCRRENKTQMDSRFRGNDL